MRHREGEGSVSYPWLNSYPVLELVVETFSSESCSLSPSFNSSIISSSSKLSLDVDLECSRNLRFETAAFGLKCVKINGINNNNNKDNNNSYYNNVVIIN